MRHLKKFFNQTNYQTYIDADDIWLPRVSYIINNPEATSGSKYSDSGPSRVEYSRIGDEFIQIANDGIMYFTNQEYVINGNIISYTADIERDAIKIQTKNLTTNEITNDAYIDEDNECIVINYPYGSQTFAIP